jgi:hypothetical protein
MIDLFFHRFAYKGERRVFVPPAQPARRFLIFYGFTDNGERRFFRAAGAAGAPHF